MFFKKKTDIVGLDIGSRTIKIAEIEEKKKGYFLKKFGMIDIAPGLIEDGSVRKPEEVADSIRQLFDVYRIKEKNITISIGGYSVIVKTISVQAMDEKQLQERIHFEAEQYIPFDINDVNLDFQIFGESENNPSQMNVLLVAAKKEMINEYVNLVQMAGLNPCIVDVDAFALQNIYEINYEPEGKDNVALIDIGANKTTLNILKGRMSVFMRDVSLGCQQINNKILAISKCSVEEAEKQYHSEQGKLASKEVLDIIETVVADWCTEIRRALDFFYSTYPDDNIKKIILSGGGAKIKKFRDLLADETAAEVEIINPFKNFSVDDEFDAAYLERIAPQAAICMGLGIRKMDDK